MTDNMLGPSPIHIKYLSYVYNKFCTRRTNLPGPIESVMSKFTCIFQISNDTILFRNYIFFCFGTSIRYHIDYRYPVPNEALPWAEVSHFLHQLATILEELILQLFQHSAQAGQHLRSEI